MDKTESAEHRCHFCQDILISNNYREYLFDKVGFDVCFDCIDGLVTEERSRRSWDDGCSEEHQPEIVSKLLANPENLIVKVFRRHQPDQVAWLAGEVACWDSIRHTIPASIPDIIEQIMVKYGGGEFRIEVFRDGKKIGSSLFEISGKPKN